MVTENNVKVTATLDDKEVESGAKRMRRYLDGIFRKHNTANKTTAQEQKQHARFVNKTNQKQIQNQKTQAKLNKEQTQQQQRSYAHTIKHHQELTKFQRAQKRFQDSYFGKQQRQQRAERRHERWVRNARGEGGRGGSFQNAIGWGRWGGRNPRGSGPGGQGRADKSTTAGSLDYLAGGALALGAGAAAAVVGVFKTQLQEGIQAYERQNMAAGGLTNIAGFDSLSGTDRTGRAQRLGYSTTETYQQALAFARQTGTASTVSYAQGLSRTGAALGMEEIAGGMGVLTRAGQGFTSSAGGNGKREFTRIMRDAVASGLDRSRTAEYLSGVSGLIDTVGGRTAGRVDTGSISAILRVMGATGQSGFQGARGAKIAGSIDQAIRGGGVGAAGKAFVQRALGYDYGGDTSWYQVQKQIEQGFLGQGGGQNLQKILNMAKRESGGQINEYMFEFLKQNLFSNLDRSVIEDIVAMNESGASGQDLVARIQAARDATGDAGISARIASAEKSSNLKVARQRANLDNRAASHGEAIYDTVVRMQNLTNEFIDHAMPTVINGLNQLGAAAEGLARGMGVTGSAPRNIQRVDSIEETYDQIEQSRMSDAQKARAYARAYGSSSTKRARVELTAGLTSDSMDHETAREQLDELYAQNERAIRGMHAIDPAQARAMAQQELRYRRHMDREWTREHKTTSDLDRIAAGQAPITVNAPPATVVNAAPQTPPAEAAGAQPGNP